MPGIFTFWTVLLVLFGLNGCSTSRHEPLEQSSCARLAIAGATHQGGQIAALTEGALGAGCGYLIGAERAKILQKNKAEAVAASRHAEEHPAAPGDVQRTDSGDLNHDGFVTLDEVLAMKQAGLGDDAIIERLRKTNQLFELTPEQARYLGNRCVGDRVVKFLQAQSPVVQAASAAPP